MSVSAFPAASSAASGATIDWVSVESLNSVLTYIKAYPVGLYRVRYYNATNGGSTVAADVYFAAADGSYTSVTTVDNDSANGLNYTEALVNVPAATVTIGVKSASVGRLSIENVGTQAVGQVVSTTTVSTSQSITFTGAKNCVLIGGGAGGNGSYGAARHGGGSGYIQKFTVQPGTYSLVIGAGGSGGSGGGAGGNGSASTFAGFTAGGGFASNGSVGGNGGSAGATANGSGTMANGGYNGTTDTAGAGGGVSSGVKLPFWAIPGAPGASANGYLNNYGRAGGWYAGGGAAGTSGDYPTGQTAEAGTGGGGGGGGYYSGGGGSGSLTYIGA
jgi:hypothetical protein